MNTRHGPALAGFAAALAAASALVLTGCGSSGGATQSGGQEGSSGAATAPELSATSFDRDFTTMSQLKALAQKGKGKIGVILPDTVSSGRYTEFDAPYLKKAFEQAGLSSSDFSILNAQGSDSTELTDAQSDIAKGASVILVDPLDSGVGASIESYAKSRGVAVIDYDRLTLGGTRTYYVSFNNVNVGKLIGQGMVQCAKDWGVTKPDVLVMRGDPTDNNAGLFFDGYMSVLNPLFSKGTWTKAGEPAGTWDPPTALTEFQQQFTAHPDINAVLVPNDENASPIVNYLRSDRKVKAQSFPVTGQDATLAGLQDILSGYQCGTAYKPIYLEAQAAAALAIYVRAGQTPPKALVNGTTKDTQAKTDVASVLLKPEWVTTKNMNDTVVADKFVPASKLCAGRESQCTAAGITP